MAVKSLARNCIVIRNICGSHVSFGVTCAVLSSLLDSCFRRIMGCILVAGRLFPGATRPGWDKKPEEKPVTEEHLNALWAALGGASSALILTHNDPDPDAIGSAVALRQLLAEKWGVDSQITYKGIIGRAENKALVRYLGRPLRRLTAADLRQGVPVALVDTQPGAGNNALPAGVVPAIVFDHHPWREATADARFFDVRTTLGSTSTMLLLYLQAAGIEPAPPLATALFYGIKTDTMGLGRGVSSSDVDAYFYLQRRIDVEALAEIERAQVPAEYFVRLDASLHAALIYNGVVMSYAGRMSRPDLPAEMADLLLRLEGVEWAVCMGCYEDDLIVAIRTRNRRGGAGTLVQEIVGNLGTAGGHSTMAGGNVPLRGQTPDQMALQLGQRILRRLGIPPDVEGKPLLS
jgi:nanoRNase/pAp phosphatase (c-di-AMP/oligoRNAs hydrolase)